MIAKLTGPVRTPSYGDRIVTLLRNPVRAQPWKPPIEGETIGTLYSIVAAGDLPSPPLIALGAFPPGARRSRYDRWVIEKAKGGRFKSVTMSPTMTWMMFELYKRGARPWLAAK